MIKIDCGKIYIIEWFYRFILKNLNLFCEVITMEENQKNIIEGEKVENTNSTQTGTTTYTTVKEIKSKKESHFGKTVVVPFFSGVVGATVVLGACFGIPSIRENLLGFNNTTIQETSNQAQSSSLTSNTNLISLANCNISTTNCEQK